MHVSIPVCFTLRFVPNNPTLKHVVHITLGLLMTYLLFGMETISMLFTAVPVYVVMRFLPNNPDANLIFVYVFGFLLFRRIFLYVYHYLEWSLDFTTTHMIPTLKLTA